jgi:hypothetical protein
MKRRLLTLCWRYRFWRRIGLTGCGKEKLK